MTKEFFISEALRFSKVITDKSEASDALLSGRRYPFPLTAGADMPRTDDHIEFIRGLLEKFPELSFVLNDNNRSAAEKIGSDYSSRIYFTNDTDAVYAVLVDFYTFFRISDKVKILFDLNKTYYARVPEKNHNFLSSLKDTFASYPNHTGWMHELYGKYEVKVPTDLLFLIYRDILPEDEITKMSKGYKDGYEEIYEHIRLMIKYPALRQRNIDFIKKMMAAPNSQNCLKESSLSFIKAIGLDI